MHSTKNKIKFVTGAISVNFQQRPPLKQTNKQHKQQLQLQKIASHVKSVFCSFNVLEIFSSQKKFSSLQT